MVAVLSVHQQGRVRAVRARNHSLSAAMNRDGILFFKTINQSYNGERYALFLEEYYKILASKGITNATLVLDNSVIHKVEAVKEKVTQHGH